MFWFPSLIKKILSGEEQITLWGDGSNVRDFTHCRDVVVAVSKAGGCGVLGAVGMSPEQLEKELKWIDEHIDGKPYGVDVLIPNKMVGKDEKFDADKLVKMIPQ